MWILKRRNKEVGVWNGRRRLGMNQIIYGRFFNYLGEKSDFVCNSDMLQEYLVWVTTTHSAHKCRCPSHQSHRCAGSQIISLLKMGKCKRHKLARSLVIVRFEFVTSWTLVWPIYHWATMLDDIELMIWIYHKKKKTGASEITYR